MRKAGPRWIGMGILTADAAGEITLASHAAAPGHSMRDLREKRSPPDTAGSLAAGIQFRVSSLSGALPLQAVDSGLQLTHGLFQHAPGAGCV